MAKNIFNFFSDDEEDNLGKKKRSPIEGFLAVFAELFRGLVGFFKNLEKELDPEVDNETFNKYSADLEDDQKQKLKEFMLKAGAETDPVVKQIKENYGLMKIANTLKESNLGDAFKIKDKVLSDSGMFTIGGPTTVNAGNMTALFADIDALFTDVNTKANGVGTPVALYANVAGVSGTVVADLNTVLTNAHNKDTAGKLKLDSAKYKKIEIEAIGNVVEIQKAVLDAKNRVEAISKKLAATPNDAGLKQELLAAATKLKKLVDDKFSHTKLTNLDAEITTTYNKQESEMLTKLKNQALKLKREFANLQTLYRGETVRITALAGAKTPAEASQLSMLTQYDATFNGLGNTFETKLNQSVNRITAPGSRKEDELEDNLNQAKEKLTGMKKFMEETVGLKPF